ncbi:MAG TPA: hypothetical protein DIT58_15530, partial [Porticoccaceae bacterium]|nr:hypothetical protein [Porticoccaceae bacterium]
SMLRRGGAMSGEQRLSGIHDMLRKLRQQRREQLERYNLDSLFDGLKEQLEQILDKEKQTVQDWIKDAGQQQGD